MNGRITALLILCCLLLGGWCILVAESVHVGGIPPIELLVPLVIASLIAGLYLLSAISQVRTDAGLPPVRRVQLARLTFFWVLICVLFVTIAFLLYASRYEFKEIWHALAYWKVIILGQE